VAGDPAHPFVAEAARRFGAALAEQHGATSARG